MLRATSFILDKLDTMSRYDFNYTIKSCLQDNKDHLRDVKVMRYCSIFPLCKGNHKIFMATYGMNESEFLAFAEENY